MSERDAKPIPTSRIRRSAKIGGLVGSQAARNAATKTANLTRSKEGRRVALERRQVEAAEQVLDALGTMKGLALKVGQVASFVDTGVFPPEFQERLQEKLAGLRDSAPLVPFKEMRKLIEDEIGEPLDNVFEEFDEQAIAAASIGQVYRARLRSDGDGSFAGREVAVKVQYPGVARAVRSDLDNLGLIMRVAKRIAPGMDAKAMSKEIRERLIDELDYEHEAQSQRAFARLWRGHPFVVIPEVVTELSRERVLVQEFVEGIGFDEVQALESAERDHYAEIVFRFFFGSLHRTGLFSGDPHPGNYLLLEDGRVAFLDFGMTKKLSQRTIDQGKALIATAMAGDADALHAELADFGYFDADDPKLPPERVLAHVRGLSAWYIADGEVTLDSALAMQIMIDAGDPRSEYWDMTRRQTVPADSMLALRMEGLMLSVLAQLEATANWHRIVREIVFGEAPATALGELEAPYWGNTTVAAAS